MRIDFGLEMPEKTGRILHLIDDDGWRIALQKSTRLFLGLLGFRGKIEGDEGMLREQAPEGRSFAGLPGSGEHDDGPGSGGTLKPGLNGARNPHVQNIR